MGWRGWRARGTGWGGGQGGRDPKEIGLEVKEGGKGGESRW